MSKKIKAVYDADPSAGNDPSTHYLIAADDDANNPVVLDIDQLSAAVSTRIGVSPPPLPTEDLNQFVVTIQENTLQANIQPVTGVDYTHIIINVDDDSTPTYPTGFTEGPFPSLGSVASWSAETWYPYAYDLTTTTLKELKNPDGTSGITVTPNDTTVPVASLAGIKNTTNPETQVDYTLTASDAHSGVNESRTRAYDATTLLAITDEGIAPLTDGVGTETLTFQPGVVTNVMFRVYDFHNNFIDTNAVEIDLDDPVDTTAGIMTLDDTANPIAAITQAESTTPMPVTVNLTGNSDGLAKTALLKVRKWTCETSAQVDTALPGAPAGTVTITPPATQADCDIVIADVDDAEDNRFEVYIDDTGGSPAPDIGTNNAIYCDLTGTGGASTGVYQLTVDKPQAGEYFGFIDADMNWTFTADNNNKNYVADGSYSLCIADGGVDDSVINDGAGGGAGAGTAPSQCFYAESGAVNETTYTNFLVPPTNTAQAVTIVNFPVTGNYYFWLRQSRSTGNYTTWLSIDGLTPSASDEFVSYDHTIDVWDFSPLCLKNTDKNTPIAKYITAGDHTVAICVREATPSLYWNRLHITTDATHDPSAAGTGPNLVVATTEPAATLPAASTTPDPNNPTALPPMGLIPAATLAPTLYPLDDTIDQPASLIISAKYDSSVTGIQIYPQALSVTSGGSPVSGVWTTNGVNEFYFADASGSPIQFGTDAAVSISGATTEVGIIYEAGVKKGIDITADGTWSFVTEAGTGQSQFTNVPLQNGSMDYTWYATATSKFTTGTDDPVSWPTLYAAALRVVSASNQLELQAALNSALPGDIILLSGDTQAVWDTLSTIQVTMPGTSANPIIITSTHKALGTSVPVSLANGSIAMQFHVTANHYIIGGLTWNSQTAKAIDLASGGISGTTFNNGATNVRITDNVFDSIGRTVGTNDGLIKVGDRCHDCRFDHNAIINPYNHVRVKYSNDSLTNPTLRFRGDHNYFGPVPNTGLQSGVTYDVGTFQFIGNSQPPSTGVDMDATVDFNVFEQPTNNQTEEEQIEIKANGVTVENNICFGSQGQQRLASRYGSRNTIQTNYCVGIGIKSFGTDNTIHDNYIDGNGTLKRGIMYWRSRRRAYPNCNYLPEQIDGTITNNTVRGCYYSSAGIAEEDAGARYRIDGLTMNNNDLSTAAGITGVAGGGDNGIYVGTMADNVDSAYAGCSIYFSGSDNLGGLNEGTISITTNTYGGTNGTLQAEDASPGGAAGSSLA